ncbi:hypothetical protein GCM10010121_031850 [Streptomyces brasiliensis]|uniref:Uncharacterized protein n=1 Tax=Streptomyces brasiliensis TaxID=1954 RepID=A0A917KN31_9ACTN|nr:hypothetical protein GCM10010121_031850 [Streptomyces brasiliensis]
MATGPSGPSPSHTVPALPRPRIWFAVYRLPIFRAKTAPTDACWRQNYAPDEPTFTTATEITRQMSTNPQSGTPAELRPHVQSL